MHKQGSTLLVGGSVGVVDVGVVDFVCGGGGVLSLFFLSCWGSCGGRLRVGGARDGGELRRRSSRDTHAHLSWLMRMFHLRGGGGGWWVPEGYGCGWVGGWAGHGDVLR